MTLRTRLLLVVLAVAALGLVASDVVVFGQLRSYLLTEVDPQLHAASFQVERAVLSRNGLIPSLPFAPPVHVQSGSVAAPPGTANASPGSVVVSIPPNVRSGSVILRQTAGSSIKSNNVLTNGGLFPAGTVGELIDKSGKLDGKPVNFIYGGSSPPAPIIPAALSATERNGNVTFTAAAQQGDPVSYRVLIRPLRYHDLSVLTAIPLSSIGQTTDRLAFIMLLVGAIVLIGLGLVAWWIVRRDLRPLEAMAATAAIVATGDYAQRVAPAEPRTEVGRLGLALNTMLTRIEGAFAARQASEQRLRRFLADASHELRTPLTSIRGYAEIFDLGARDRPDDLETSMHRIREEADRMSTLVNDLLLLARHDHERPLALVATNLAAVLTKGVISVRAAFPGHAIEVAGLHPDVSVSADPDRLRQVVDNLLANAVRHSPDGAPVAVRLSLEDGNALVEIEDQGPGVAVEDTERIFEAFYRADSSRARTTGGAGLGLAIVADIVTEHAGTVGTRPPEGAHSGAIFWVKLPLLDRAVALSSGSERSGDE